MPLTHHGTCLPRSASIRGALACLALLAAVATAGAQPADCPAPMFGLDLGNTGQSDYVGIIRNPRAIWSRFMGGGPSFYGSMALSDDGIIFVPNDVGHGAFLAANGRDAWSAKAGWRDTRAALDVRGNFYAFEGGSLRARDADTGTLLWQGVPCPVSDGEAVKIAADGTIYAPDIRGVISAYTPDGTLKWQSKEYGLAQYGEEAIVPALDAAGNLYIRGGNKWVSLAPDGKERWTVTENTSDGSRIILAPDGNMYSCAGGAVRVRNTQTGALIRSLTVSGILRAVDDEGSLYVVNSAMVRKMDPLGNTLWTYSRDSFARPLVVDADHKVYCSLSQGNILALSPTGTLLWDLPVTGSYSLCDPIIGADGTLYVQTGTRLMAIVPEPCSLALLGLAGLSLLARRRRQGSGR